MKIAKSHGEEMRREFGDKGYDIMRLQERLEVLGEEAAEAVLAYAKRYGEPIERQRADGPGYHTYMAMNSLYQGVRNTLEVDWRVGGFDAFVYKTYRSLVDGKNMTADGQLLDSEGNPENLEVEEP